MDSLILRRSMAISELPITGDNGDSSKISFLISHQKYVVTKVSKYFSTTSTVYAHPELFELSLKAPSMTAADDIHKYFFIVFLKKIRLDISCESSASRIHMKYQVLFSSKDKSKKLKCRLLQFLFGALTVRSLNLLGSGCCFISPLKQDIVVPLRRF